MSAAPPDRPGGVYRGRPQGLDPPVGRRAVRAPGAAVAALYLIVGVVALVLRAVGG